MKAALISVPHTGTRLVRDRLLKPFTDAGGTLVTGHAYIDWVDPGPFEVVIVPMRHPARVRHSWDKRGKFHDRVNPKRWGHCWDALKQIESPYYIHVDIPNVRDEQVERLAGVLGVSLSHDWSPYANATTHDTPVSECPFAMKDKPLEDFYWRTALCHHD